MVKSLAFVGCSARMYFLFDENYLLIASTAIHNTSTVFSVNPVIVSYDIG